MKSDSIVGSGRVSRCLIGMKLWGGRGESHKMGKEEREAKWPK
jgi:hypothetical protein